MVNPDTDKRTVGAWMSRSPVVIAYDATLAEAARLMAEHEIRHLPVVRDGGPVGVVTDRDIAIVLGLSSGADTQRVRVAEAMTPVPYAVLPGAPLKRVAEMMARYRYGCALVTDEQDKCVLGVFTSIDALHALADLLESAG